MARSAQSENLSMVPVVALAESIIGSRVSSLVTMSAILLTLKASLIGLLIATINLSAKDLYPNPDITDLNTISEAVLPMMYALDGLGAILAGVCFYAVVETRYRIRHVLQDDSSLPFNLAQPILVCVSFIIINFMSFGVTAEFNGYSDGLRQSTKAYCAKHKEAHCYGVE